MHSVAQWSAPEVLDMNDINRALSFQEHLRPGEIQVGIFISEAIACRYFMIRRLWFLDVPDEVFPVFSATSY